MDGLINTDQQSKYFQNKKKQCYQFEDTLLKKNSWNWLWVLLKKKKNRKTNPATTLVGKVLVIFQAL